MDTILLHPPLLEGEGFSVLRQNPDRGWRMETYLTLGSNTVMFHAGETPLGFLDAQIELYRDTPCTLVQVYVYLTEYCKKPLDDTAFAQLNAYLEGLRARHLRAVLRFAYEFDVDRKIGPTSRRIYGHLRQIKQWFAENDPLVRDTVLVLQAGILGAWGEWHTARHYHNKKKLLFALCDTAPAYLPLQVRMQKFKDCVQNTDNAPRIGYHDDFLVGAYYKWNTPAGAPDSERFQNFVKESRFTLNDGEMPWGRDKTVHDGFIDGFEMLTACAEHSLSTLSLTHNYKEENGQFNMVRWRSETLTALRASELGCPRTSAYFTQDGQALERTVFDFLTDHLGYQIAVREIFVGDAADDRQTATVKLSNDGFALPYAFTKLRLHIADASGNVKQFNFTDYAPEKLLGGGAGTFSLTDDFGEISKIGLSLEKETYSPCAVRFANRCAFDENGVNWFEITP
ncbi:MAG: DUF4874 domain-containing protein [Clostridia bacterium]|nr:DUF4874 domain-containing protein [Clostridia bacterium]